MNHAAYILDLLIKIQESSDVFPDELEDIFKGVSLLEVHCVDRIGTIDYANVTKIADEMNLTRGGVSKICKRMIEKGYLESYKRPDNNKEIYYKLTDNGRQIYKEHKKIHNKANKEELAFLNTFSESEQAVILRFLSGIHQLHN